MTTIRRNDRSFEVIDRQHRRGDASRSHARIANDGLDRGTDRLLRVETHG